MWLALAACAGPQPDADTMRTVPPPPPEASPTGGRPIGSVTPGGAPIPGIAEALGDCDGTFVDPGEYPNQLEKGDDLHRLLLVDPDARCNDGTPAALYLRAATDPAHADDWVLHLQGGSHCTSYEDCEKRWCGTGFYDASKMSSAWTPQAIAGVGIFDEADHNGFASWNQVFFYYCTSDVWSGQGGATLVSADGDALRVERRGHLNFIAGIRALEAGSSSDDGDAVLASILGARQVLLTGTSGGSVGAQIHLDWLRARWPEQISLIGVFDAAISPAPATVPAAVADQVDADDDAEFSQTLAQSDVPPWGDASCLAGIDDADRWQCGSSSRLPYQWITTPFLVRMDLADPPTGDTYEDAGATSDEFAAGVAASLLQLAASEVGGRKVGAYGPACGEHLGLEVDAFFLHRPVVTDAGSVTLKDAVQAYDLGEDVAVVDVTRQDSVCQ